MNDDREAKLEKLLHENNITFLSDMDINRVIQEITNAHKAHNMCSNKQFIDDYTLTLYVKNMHSLGVIIGNISASEFNNLYNSDTTKIIDETLCVVYDAIDDLFDLSSPIVFEKRKLETMEDMRQWCFKNPLKIVGVQRNNKVAIKTLKDVNNLVVGFARDINGFTFTHVLSECKYTTDDNTQDQLWIHYSEIDVVE
jgi:hypothetical protein